MIEAFVNELQTLHNSLCPWKDAPVSGKSDLEIMETITFAHEI